MNLKLLKRINNFAAVNGVDIGTALLSIRGVPAFVFDLLKYLNSASGSGFKVRFKNLYCVLGDRYKSAGVATGHYFHQDLWMAREIYLAKPTQHVDVGSSVNGFVSHLLVFMENVQVIDIRRLESKVKGLTFIQDNATQLASFDDDSIESLSTLHACEHFGLGRYGDPIDPMGYSRFMCALSKKLKSGGRLYFSVPTGIERLEFNAHRVFSPRTIINNFGDLKLIKFALIKDDGNLDENASLAEAEQQEFGCGLYVFTK